MGYRERMASLFVEAVRLHYQNADDIVQRLKQIQDDMTKLKSKVNRIERELTLRTSSVETREEGLSNDFCLAQADTLLIQAADCVVEQGQASTSFVQRRLRVGYSRASRIIDDLADAGIIGPSNGSRARWTIAPAKWEHLREKWMSSGESEGSPPSLDGGLTDEKEA